MFKLVEIFEKCFRLNIPSKIMEAGEAYGKTFKNALSSCQRHLKRKYHACLKGCGLTFHLKERLDIHCQPWQGSEYLFAANNPLCCCIIITAIPCFPD